MGSQVTAALDLDLSVVIGTDQAFAFAEKVFLGHGLLVLDDVQWRADLEVIRTALVKKRRAFKDPFIEKEPKKPVRKQVRNLVEQASELFDQLYPSFKYTQRRESFRPMITGPEPLHFDTYGGNIIVTAYVNVSRVPRVYNIGATFPALVRKEPEAMAQMAAAAKARGDVDLSYVLREHVGTPLGVAAPRHRVELAPGAIWFFNAKTVSHEVVYGEGAVGISWEVPSCGAATQMQILAKGNEQ